MTDLMKRIAAAGRDLVEVADGVSISNIDFATELEPGELRLERARECKP